MRDPANGRVAEWAVHDRLALAAGSRLAGPAIVAEDETSTLVPSGWKAELDALGYIHLTREVGQ